MPGRSPGNTAYPFTFNGQRDDKWNGNNSSQVDFGARIHDARLGRFFTTDPAKSGWSFEAPYIFAGNTPIQAIDKNGEKIYFINKNGKIIDACALLKKTKAGQILLNYYETSNTHDVYIKVTDKEFNETYKNALGVTTAYDAGLNKVEDGKIDFEEIFHDLNEFVKEFQGMDVSQSDGKIITLVALNKSYFDDKGDVDPYLLAFALYHEIAAHILYGLAGGGHKEFGNFDVPIYLINGKTDYDYSWNDLLFKTNLYYPGKLADIGLKQLNKMKENEKKAIELEKNLKDNNKKIKDDNKKIKKNSRKKPTNTRPSF